MAFFPEEVFQVYDPVACKKFVDKMSLTDNDENLTDNDEKPAQIVVAASRRNGDFNPLMELVAGDPEFQGSQAKKLPFTPGEDSWEIIDEFKFKGRELRKSHQFLLYNHGTGVKKWVRKHKMAEFPRDVFHNWDAEQCEDFHKNPNASRHMSRAVPVLRSNTDAAALAKKKGDGHIDAICASASECKLVEKKLASLRYRDPQFQNPLVDCYTLVESTKPCIISDPHGRKCYLPALAYVLGSPTVFNRDIKSMLESASIEQLSSLLHKQHGIEIVRKGFSILHNEYLSLLQNKVIPVTPHIQNGAITHHAVRF